ncbi:MAG: BspA family leucine-rich repeat surface protein, partial [Bacteroidaceae bacterium]|nr:BspA family leucine-rich repeat surface protein [Bacteroidaceae bacterium]
MKKNLLITLIMMLVALTSGMKAMAAEKQAYYVINGGTLYFYYDENYDSRQGTDKGLYGYHPSKSQPYWRDGNYHEIVRAVFDSSFADYHPEVVQYMFQGCIYLTTIDGLENLRTDKADSFDCMFMDCINLQGTLNLSGWNTSNVTRFANMFNKCRSLQGTLNLSGWNTSNATTFNGMFGECYKLNGVNVSGWNTCRVTDVGSMFDGCQSLTELDLSSWDMSNVTNMYAMFCGCKSLRDIDVSHWNTYKVTSMKYMFDNCYSLQTLDLGSWNTSGVTAMDYMFRQCVQLTTIYCGDKWTTINVQSSDRMFVASNKLVGGEGTTYDPDHTDATYARIDGGPDAPGYLTANYIPIDQAHFPDHRLRDFLKWESYGADGKLYRNEIKEITQLDLGGQNIEDLTGIKYFTMLEKLNFNVNYVKYVDLSKNKALKVISCQ